MVIFLLLHNTAHSAFQIVLLAPNMKREWPIILMSVQSDVRIKLILDLIICLKMNDEFSISNQKMNVNYQLTNTNISNNTGSTYLC